jgi:hypothetical protein
MATDEAADERAPSNGERATTPVDDSAASAAHNANCESPAARQLAAINKGAKSKSKTSRLRRAFSFGSAAELRKAAEAASDADARPEPAKLHKNQSPEEQYESEQARIAKKQEEGGIGNSIYGARLFSGSTDNLSISSTASSASIMIRKMGRGMKRTSRSLVGLFRPKSVVGAPAADSLTAAPSNPAEPTVAAVSMVTAEAERELVNVNPDPHTQPGGGTGFPHLERNSIDAAKAPSTQSERVGSSGTDQSGSRKSIVGGDRERAEALAAVRKGILKSKDSYASHCRRQSLTVCAESGTSPTRSPSDNGSVTNLPGVPNIADSPNSSAPSTPNDEAQGHKRSDSVAIGNEDYFVSALRLRQDSKGGAGTPNQLKRSATFSPRIVFYDTWPSQEYDRRGEIATCNRLTPMLAQQIKEELNTFKMVWNLVVFVPFPFCDCLTDQTGNGGARKLQDLHAFFLTITDRDAAQDPPVVSLFFPAILGNHNGVFSGPNEHIVYSVTSEPHAGVFVRAKHCTVSGAFFLLIFTAFSPLYVSHHRRGF